MFSDANYETTRDPPPSATKKINQFVPAHKEFVLKMKNSPKKPASSSFHEYSKKGIELKS